MNQLYLTPIDLTDGQWHLPARGGEEDAPRIIECDFGGGYIAAAISEYVGMHPLDEAKPDEPVVFMRTLPDGRPYAEEYVLLVPSLPAALHNAMPDGAFGDHIAELDRPYILFCRLHAEGRLSVYSFGDYENLARNPGREAQRLGGSGVWLTWHNRAGYWPKVDALAEHFNRAEGIAVLESPPKAPEPSTEPAGAPETTEAPDKSEKRGTGDSKGSGSKRRKPPKEPAPKPEASEDSEHSTT